VKIEPGGSGSPAEERYLRRVDLAIMEVFMEEYDKMPDQYPPLKRRRINWKINWKGVFTFNAGVVFTLILLHLMGALK